MLLSVLVPYEACRDHFNIDELIVCDFSLEMVLLSGIFRSEVSHISPQPVATAVSFLELGQLFSCCSVS